MTTQKKTTQKKLENSSLDVLLDEDSAFAILEPKAKLTKEDFEAASAALDPFIRERGELQGMMIKTRDFPGYDSLEDMAEHFKFIKSHHDKIGRVALVTDAPVASMVERLGDFLTKSEVKHFDFADAANAERWACAS